MYAKMKKIINGITIITRQNHINGLSIALFLSYTAAATCLAPSMPTFTEAHKSCKKWLNRKKSKCPVGDNVCDSTKEGPITNKGEELKTENSLKKGKHENESSEIKPIGNEIRIILLGATGSGKSSAGNILLKNKKGFKTSCYAKPETKQSKLKILEKVEIDSKEYKIYIIDTPAAWDTGLTNEEAEHEIQKAIALSSPGPHAFLFCIPATAITKYNTDAIKPYEKYFGDRLYDFTIVAFTKYDKFETGSVEIEKERIFNLEFKRAMAPDSSLTKIKNLRKHRIFFDNKSKDELKQVIAIINETNGKDMS